MTQKPAVSLPAGLFIGAGNARWHTALEAAVKGTLVVIH
jgi:hypothetical protein